MKRAAEGRKRKPNPKTKSKEKGYSKGHCLRGLGGAGGMGWAGGERVLYSESPGRQGGGGMGQAEAEILAGDPG